MKLGISGYLFGPKNSSKMCIYPKSAKTKLTSEISDLKKS